MLQILCQLVSHNEILLLFAYFLSSVQRAYKYSSGVKESIASIVPPLFISRPLCPKHCKEAICMYHASFIPLWASLQQLVQRGLETTKGGTMLAIGPFATSIARRPKEKSKWHNAPRWPPSNGYVGKCISWPLVASFPTPFSHPTNVRFEPMWWVWRRQHCC